ncbi:MAG: DUF6745 domain-containing protein, partial [Nanoarchaeota archaeon]
LEIHSKIHNENGPAVYLDDGSVLYFWHGFRVPDWFVEKPETITLSMILEEGNIEWRRMLIERYGQGRFLKELQGIKEHEDDKGILWKIPRKQLEDKYEEQDFNFLFGRSRASKFVEVKDSSTDRVYFLQVPLKMKKAKEAIAWSFKLTEDEYNPIKET